MKCILFLSVFLPSLLAAAVAPDLADRVDVIIGTTGPQGRVNYGGVCPWVSPPFAMTQWMPMIQENEISKLPYRHEQRTLAGCTSPSCGCRITASSQSCRRRPEVRDEQCAIVAVRCVSSTSMRFNICKARLCGLF